MKSNVMQLISYVLSPYQMSSLRLHYLLLMLFFSPQCFFHQLFSWCITCSWFFKVRVERLFLKAVEKIVKIWKPTTFLSRYMSEFAHQFYTFKWEHGAVTDILSLMRFCFTHFQWKKWKIYSYFFYVLK